MKKKLTLTQQEILKLWNQGKTPSWRIMTNKGKTEWFKSCLYWSNLPRNTIKSQNYIIDGLQIKNDLDLYCLLGEVFFGYRGYFGQDTHGFNDCFTEISIYQSKVVESGSKITFIESQKLSTVLNKKYSEYFGWIIDILQKHGFQVILA